MESYYSSKLNIKSQGSDLILDICRLLDAEVYLSGISGKAYLDLNKFSDNNIEVLFQNYHSKSYGQLNDNFIPNLSILDFLMTCDSQTFSDYVKE